MASRYTSWSNLTNPALGTFTNTLVNHNVGVYILQTSPSPIHVLAPASKIGKKFTVANAVSSSENVIIEVPTEGGIEAFTILPGDSGGFLWIGDGIWEETDGEAVFNELTGGHSFIGLTDTPSSYSGSGEYIVRVKATQDGLEFVPTSSLGYTVNQFARTITFSDAPDAGPTSYSIGTIPVNSRVTKVSIQVTQSFNDNTCSLVTIDATGGFTTLMAHTEVDIGDADSYIAELPATQVSNGQITATFNSVPNGDGGTQGSLTVFVQFALL